MKITTALTLLLALMSSTSTVTAQETGGINDESPFTYRYTKTVIVGGGGSVVTPPTDPGDGEDDGDDEEETPPQACGTFELGLGFTAKSQSLDSNGDCVFEAPKYGRLVIGFDYTTAEAYCASTMNGGGRIAKIGKLEAFGTRSVRANGSQVSTSFQIPGIDSITCSTSAATCNNGEFQDGGSCLPKTNLSCGRLKNDSLHFLPAGTEVEMASIGECTFQIPQVTIGPETYSIMGEGQTMQKWVDTLKPNGYNDFDAFISAYSLSASSAVDYAHWRTSANTPTVPRISYKMVDYITIADTGYGSPATLPANLVATPIASGGVDMPLTTTVTIRFTPEASANGESQIADIDLYDIAGQQINVISSSLKSDSGNEASTSLIDYNGSTTETFITPSNDSISRPRAVTLVFSSANRIGSVAFRAASSNAKFPYSFAVYATADANDNTPLFYAGTRQYQQSVKVQGGQWTRILNPVYNQ